MKNYLKSLTIIIITMVLVIPMNYCNKPSNNLSVNSDEQDYQELIEKSNAMQEHILAFKTKMEYHRDNPNIKSISLKQIDSTIADWESTINYTYCYDYFDLVDAVSYDTIIDIPLIEGDSITMANVASKYFDDILVAIQEQYFQASFDKKKLMTVDLKAINEGDSLMIKSLIGNTQTFSMPPFDWYYGNWGGTCVDEFYKFTLDASIIIAQNSRFNFSVNPPAGYNWFFGNIEEIEVLDPLEKDAAGNYIYDNPNDYIINNYKDFLIYYADDNVEDGLIEEVRCLEYSDDLAFYKQSYINLTQGWINNSNGKSFKNCEYSGIEYTDGSQRLRHELTTYIGNRYLGISFNKGDISTY